MMQHQTPKMVGGRRHLVLQEILNEKQIHHVLKQCIGEDVPWKLKCSEVKPAMEGIAGFLGDHMKAVLHVEVGGELRKVHLFMKSIPACNKPKADFIHEHHFFKREMLMFKILDEIREDGPHLWCVNAYIYTDSIVVMPDLTFEGYAPRHYLYALDTEHVFIATTSIAQFHAAFVNYETRKSNTQEYGNILGEPTFCDCPWLRACSKLSASFLKNFSMKPYRAMPGLEAKLMKLYIEGCHQLIDYSDTVNILLHRDLWVNNIMFKYENGAPTNAVLVDYQCLRYGPPAFDLMSFLYLTTGSGFREQHERDILDHYYAVFVKNLSEDSKQRLEAFKYDKNNFLKWCDKARMFGMLVTIAIYPFILMDPVTAQKTFDDPHTFEKYLYEDRSEPVTAYAAKCEPYKQRNLEIIEEFVERYMLRQL